MSRFERWAVWTTSLATLVTGVVYLWLKYLLVSEDPFAVVNHPWQPVVLKLHILAAPLLTFSVGLVALRHIWRHLRSAEKTGRRSGLVMVLLVGPMIVTGYLIQAITHRGWLQAMVISHIGVGLLYGLGLAGHQVAVGAQRKGRREKVRVSPAPAPPPAPARDPAPAAYSASPARSAPRR